MSHTTRPSLSVAHEDRARRHRAARRARARPSRWAHDRARAYDGRAARGPPVADPPRPRTVRRGGRLAVRQPRPVRRALPTSSATPAGSATTPRSPREAGADVLFAPLGRGGLSAGVRHLRRGARRDRPAGGRGPRRRSFSRREHGRHEAAVHDPARRRLLRPEGRPAGRRHPPAGRPTSTCRCGSRPARPCASPTAWRCPAATPCSSPDERGRALALPAALRAAAELAGTGERSTAALLGAAARRDGPSIGVAARVPGDRRPRHVRVARPTAGRPALLVLAARVGEIRLIDNVMLTPVAVRAMSAAGARDPATSHQPTGASTCSA